MKHLPIKDGRSRAGGNLVLLAGAFLAALLTSCGPQWNTIYLEPPMVLVAESASMYRGIGYTDKSACVVVRDVHGKLLTTCDAWAMAISETYQPGDTIQ